MVQSACVEGLMPFDQADLWWQMAKWQNHYALYCRYGDALPCVEVTDLEVNRTSVETELHPGAIVRAIACWNYQCAEFEDHDKTRVSIMFEALGQLLRAQYPDIDFDADYPWGISDWDDVIWRKETA
jgi:hypothetical protein